MSSHFSDLHRKRDEDSCDEVSPFCGIDKGTVLQEARCFNDAQLDARKCQQVITKLLYLRGQGEVFTKTEITEIFFSVTKLFQSKDNNLRRMVYLIVKEISPSSDEVIIVTSSLMKDMNSKVDLYRANAIRVLCCIADSAILGQIERYLKQAIVDRSDAVSSAALIAATHLIRSDMDIVRRWTSEIQEAINSPCPNVQFHALGLLYEIRKTDRLAVNKLVVQLTKTQLRSPLSYCLLIRYVALVATEVTDEMAVPLIGFLQNCLRHKSEMVVFEAVLALTSQIEVNTALLGPVVNVLQLLLSSPKPSSRFASMRVINKIASTLPDLVSSCNTDIENLINDENKSIATLAVTTLLKTGSEATVERLLLRIHSFMSEIQDEFKIMVVEAIRVTCARLAPRYRLLLSFLSTHLREEGGFEYKQCIVHTIIELFHEIYEAKELSLSYLAEFIEDCEYTHLSCEILYLLGEEAPDTPDPGKYLRYIYNRVVLENPSIRAAAISAMANIGLNCEALVQRVRVLLRRCLFDTDDEVRDRASASIILLDNPLQVDIAAVSLHTSKNLEKLLGVYCESEQFDELELTSMLASAQNDADDVLRSGDVTTELHTIAPDQPSCSNIDSLPQVADFGELFKSSARVELTEDETEYKVSCIKHIYSEHVVFEFLCSNTIEEQKLTNISVIMEEWSATGLQEVETIPLEVMPLNSYGSTFCVFKYSQIPLSRFSCTMKFVSKEIDVLTGETEDEGYEDEYSLEDIEVCIRDCIRTKHTSDFNAAWNTCDPHGETTGSFSSQHPGSIHEAVDQLCSILSLKPVVGQIPQRDSSSHFLCFSAEVPTSRSVLVKVHLSEDISGIKQVVGCRSDEEGVCSLLLNALIDRMRA